MTVAAKEFAASEAKSKFSELLDRVEAGEEIIIRRHGKVVARLVGPDDREAMIARRRKAWDEWKAYRKERKITLGPDLSPKDLIDEGRRS